MELLNKLLAIDPNYVLIGFIAVFYSLEQILNTQFKFRKRPQHLFHNILFQLAFILGNLLWATVTVFSIEWLNKNEIGLFYLFQVPVWLKLVLAVAMFDLMSYWFHRIAHVVPVLWRFHRVHHSDTSMDASTTFRSHPLELTLWFGTSNIIAAGVFGLDLLSLALYFLVATPFFFLEHSNLKFPKWLDKTIGLVFTTPNIHKVHHEQDQYYTDSNFSDIFILWDRIFGTFKYKSPEQIKFGLKEFENDKKQTFWYLMISPFIKMGRVSSEELRKGK
ncbi:MAG TPA: sterol desaturase family protein [Chitinophagaceae bacterium]|nr:sterol desaturase family protein [Chitinophagaceae bacterium]